MRSISKSLIAATTAAAVALSVTPAMAQSADGSAEGSAVGSSGSSAVAESSEATDSQRNVWGSSKDFDNATGFDQLTYVYVIGSVAALVGGAAAFASQTPQAQELAEQFNIDLPRFF